MRDVIGQLLLSKISDPRIDPARVSVTRVEVMEDLLTARVYISVIGAEGQQRAALRALRHAGGHIQELMMRQISLRNTPILEFRLDEQFKKALQTLGVISQVSQELRAVDEARAKAAQQAADDQAAAGRNETPPQGVKEGGDAEDSNHSGPPAAKQDDSE